LPRRGGGGDPPRLAVFGEAGASPYKLSSRLPMWVFDETYARRLFQEQFQVATLSGFDCEEIPLGVTAAGAILHYVRETQKRTSLPHITTLKRHRPGDFLVYSDETYRSLEVGGLTELLDRTETAMGGRLLRQWIRYPLTQKGEIESRLEMVGELKEKEAALAGIQESLKKIYDLERITARLSLKTINARDLLALGVSLREMEMVREPLQSLSSGGIKEILLKWDSLSEIAWKILETLRQDPPFSLRDGGMIADRVHAELDGLRQIKQSSQASLAAIEKREKERTGISSLKVGFNRVFGYYIEVTTAHLQKVPPDYFRKQTLANAERFITPELKEFEGTILGADEKIRALEYQIFIELRDQISQEISRIKAQSERVARIDTLASLAKVSKERGLNRPRVVEGSLLEIKGGRHLLVESYLPSGRFVPNDIHLDTEGQRLILITGPNMAGKSTVIRQVGLIVLMAQIGSFVPAVSAVIGVVDHLFSRIGASDRLSHGESTFMVEMSETASILHHATEKSLILLDEIGRGTSTFDGLSLAWALAEYLHDRLKSKTLFATHYHELIDLALTRPGIRNEHVMVKEEGEGIVFLYRLVSGGMSHSYGIHVARLAGVPKEILDRAKEVLENLEQGEFERGAPRLGKRHKTAHHDQGTLF
ncbi:MAG: DNA mismatch repair protein MutS, partial [Deltaproteobacteria bacterium]|nr:DNA mismatch repair protein MutS [Deltaproteobacteria bacterium]